MFDDIDMEEIEYYGEYDHYDVDEYYDDEPQIEGYSVWQYVYKATNGHVVFYKVILTRWTGQDWGECDSETEFINLNEFNILTKANCLALARNLQPNGSCSFEWLHISNWIMYLNQPLPYNWQQLIPEYINQYGAW